MVENQEIDLTSFSKPSTVLGTQQALNIYLLDEQSKLIPRGEASYSSHGKEALTLRNHIMGPVCNVKFGHLHMQKIEVLTNSNKRPVGSRF